MEGADLAVSVKDATRRFGDVIAIENISFEVPRGTILGVIGPSGSGKTTTLRMLMGSLAPTGGEVRVLGEEPLHFRRQTRERIGYMPQAFILYPDLTVRENVDFVGSLFGLLMFRRRRRVREVLELVDLWDVRGRRAKDLSGGMQRRLELACAMVHDPTLLVLDEPTAGIDPILRRTIWDELHRLRDTGRTLLITTQYVTEAEECDEVALVSEGRLIAFAEPEALRHSAYGGDVVEVTTTKAFDASLLELYTRVRSVKQLGLHDFRVVIDDAAVGLPDIVEAVATAGGEVEAAREARPSFEEVFAELVERDLAERDRARQDTARAGIETPPEEPNDVPEPDRERRAPNDLPPPQDAPGAPEAPEIQRAPSADEDVPVGGVRGRA